MTDTYHLFLHIQSALGRRGGVKIASSALLLAFHSYQLLESPWQRWRFGLRDKEGGNDPKLRGQCGSSAWSKCCGLDSAGDQASTFHHPLCLHLPFAIPDSCGNDPTEWRPEVWPLKKNENEKGRQGRRSIVRSEGKLPRDKEYARPTSAPSLPPPSWEGSLCITLPTATTWTSCLLIKARPVGLREHIYLCL